MCEFEFNCSVCTYKSEWTWKSVLLNVAFLRLIIAPTNIQNIINTANQTTKYFFIRWLHWGCVIKAVRWQFVKCSCRFSSDKCCRTSVFCFRLPVSLCMNISINWNNYKNELSVLCISVSFVVDYINLYHDHGIDLPLYGYSLSFV